MNSHFDAAAYLLGEERRFENKPKVECGEMVMRDNDVAHQDSISVS